MAYVYLLHSLASCTVPLTSPMGEAPPIPFFILIACQKEEILPSFQINENAVVGSRSLTE